MNEPLDPRPLQTVNRLRLAVLLPVLLAVVAIILFATKLARQFKAGEEPAERTFAPPRPSVAGRSPPEVAEGTESSAHQTLPGRSNSLDRLRSLRPHRGEPVRPAVVPGSPTTDSPPVSPPVPLPPAPVQPVLGEADLSPNGIVGRVFLRGTPSPEIAIPMDPACGRLNPLPVATRFYVVDTHGGLADVFVELKDFPSGLWKAPSIPLEIHNRSCLFQPYVSAAQFGQTIRVFNDDPVMHTVHLPPPPGSSREANHVQLPGAAPVDFLFPLPGQFLRLTCDVHPWMFAYVNVVEHPFFAVSGTNGTFSIPVAPPGNYTLQFTHRKAGGKSVPVKVQAGKRLVVTVTLDLEDHGRSEATVTEE